MQVNQVGVGVGHLLAGDPNHAEMPLFRAARQAADHGNVLQLGVALQALAALAAVRGDVRPAAQLWGAGTNWAPLWPMFRRRYGPFIGPVRDELGEDFDAERGAELDPATALKRALHGSAA